MDILYELIEKEYIETLKEISEIDGSDIKDIDDILVNTMKQYYNETKDIFDKIMNSEEGGE